MATSEDCYQSTNIHIHNYSAAALQTLVSAVKPYPIIFDGTITSSPSTAPIDLAWTGIVTSFMKDVDLAQQRYWDQSFRAAWKWMRSFLIKDMIARRYNHVQVERPDFNLLAHLNFLEEYIDLDKICSTDYQDAIQSDAGIQIKVPVVETVELRKYLNSSSIFWIQGSTEPEDYRNTLISICFRVQCSSSMAFNVERSPQLNDDSKLSEVDNTVITLSSDSSNSSDENAISNPAQYASCQSSTQRLPSFQEAFKTPQTTNEAESNQSKEEDYEYIMSLLPKLKQLEPEKNIRAKLFMMRAALGLLRET